MSDSCNPIDCSPPGSSVHRISQEYWSGLPFPAPGDLLDPEMEPRSPALAGRFFTTEPPGSSGFCHTATWISHMYTYIPSLLNLPPTCQPIPPLLVIAEHWVELHGYTATSCWLFYPWQCIFNATLPICPTLSFPYWGHIILKVDTVFKIMFLKTLKYMIILRM